ncbi:MAG: S-methyl-5-thioribose-1-phosphate isomerase [Mogibacterium sp.]|nr:S-methyl-5-thioribose-1-phosphate isomerase [Mogibacterium sp.]
MDRQDKDLAWMLQFENIAWYEDGRVDILDRRIYPIEVRKLSCHSHQEVAKAIKDMVTQSAGPYVACSMGMALAAYECRGKRESEQLAYLDEAAYRISHARPTTTWRMQKICEACISAAREALSGGISDVSEVIKEFAIEQNNKRYAGIGIAGRYLAELFPNKGAVMTQCFAETIVGIMLREARAQGKDIKLYCPETRPFFQGSRLTATVCHDMGFDVTVITDNMPAAVIKNEGIDIFTSAADVICCDGYVVNKVGTYQIAIAAKYHGVPYYVSGAPDQGHQSIDSVHIEMRNPADVLEAMGTPTANPNVKGYYPAFDITPPNLVTGVVTDQGVFDPYKLADYSAGPDDFLV